MLTAEQAENIPRQVTEHNPGRKPACKIKKVQNLYFSILLSLF